VNKQRCHFFLSCGEFLGVAVLFGLAIFFVATSWRKWPDPLIDFGAQLYTAWQLSQGAVLHRDVATLYGPLSHYFNAALFCVFGPGLIVLAIANLVIFSGLLITIYMLIRRAWGIAAALVSSAIFISVFGFSHLVYGGNYNYVTPYSHETTHGMLIVALLCLVLLHWIDHHTSRSTFLAGFLFGLTTLLKPEFILAGAIITAVAALVRWRNGGRLQSRELFAWIIAALLPTALFAIYFVRVMPYLKRWPRPRAPG
jgi:hypothetical protein